MARSGMASIRPAPNSAGVLREALVRQKVLNPLLKVSSRHLENVGSEPK